MSKESLEWKLRAIQDLKKEKYIGTQEAWEYLRAIEAIYTIPKNVADTINQELRLELSPRLHYEASPANVLGILDTLKEISHGIDKLIINYNKGGIRAKMEINDMLTPMLSYPMNIMFPEFSVTKRLEGKDFEDENDEEYIFGPEPMIEELIPLYREANLIGMDNVQFGAFVIESVCSVFFESLTRENYFEFRQIAEEYVREELENIHWDSVFSAENLRKIERELRDEAYRVGINLFVRVDRLFRDQIDHRLENRREIAADYLIGFSSLEEALSEIDKQIDYEEKNGFDSKRVKFIRHALVSDKSYFRKYLRA